MRIRRHQHLGKLAILSLLFEPIKRGGAAIIGQIGHYKKGRIVANATKAYKKLQISYTIKRAIWQL